MMIMMVIMMMVATNYNDMNNSEDKGNVNRDLVLFVYGKRRANSKEKFVEEI